MNYVINILGDPALALAAIGELAVLMAGRSASELGLDIPDEVGELISLHQSPCTAGTREIWMRIEPSDRLRDLLATLRARQGDGVVIEHG